MSTDPINETVAALDRALRGPARARADVLREVRDGLDDAAEAYASAGLVPAEAQRRAVHEFGDVRIVAEDMQTELTARYGRSTALLLALVFPALMLLWDVLWMTGVQWAHHGSEYVALLADVIDTTSLAVGLAGGIVLVVLFLDGRSSGAAPMVTGGVGVLALVTLALAGGSSVLMQFLKDSWALYREPTVVALYVVTVLCACWIVMRAWRCLHLARAARPGRRAVSA